MRTSFRVRIVPVVIVAAVAAGAWLASACAQHEPDPSARLTPRQAFMKLDSGYRSCKRDNASIAKCFSCSRDSTRAGQRPYAAVLACMDSRVSPEYVFNAPPGALFTYRTPGNVVDNIIVAGMEYAVAENGSSGKDSVPLIVVMGHTGCGAIKTACDSTKEVPPLLRSVLKGLEPVIKRTAASGYPSEGCNQKFLDSVASNNVLDMIETIKRLSPEIRRRYDNKTLGIVGGRFDVATGDIVWLTPPPER